ncbi:MAG: hypothetical protein JXA46_12695 [Dehalococcoidales bacterium]|nr:hypothetical protein [Dehalococcoidales bacterium]
MKYRTLILWIVILLVITPASISCEQNEDSSKLEKRPAGENQKPGAGPSLPDFSIDNVEIMYSYQYEGKQPVTFSAPFNGNVRVDSNWVPLDPIPEEYGTFLVVTLSNQGNAGCDPEKSKSRIDVYVDGSKVWSPLNVSPCELQPGESFVYHHDNDTGEISGFMGDIPGESEKILFDLVYDGDEIDKDNNKYEVTVTYTQGS